MKPIKIDMHVHTHYSGDSNLSPKDLIRAARARGLDALAVMDHGTVRGALETVAEARGTGLLIIPGEEIRTRDGEIIALDINRDIKEGMSLLETCRQIKEQNGFILIPHPFDSFRQGIGDRIQKIKKYADAIEVFNSRTLFNSSNKKAEEFARENGIPAVAGSDAHFSEEVGNAYTVLNCANHNANDYNTNNTNHRTQQDVFRAIRNHEARLVTTKTSIKRYPKTIVLKMRKAFQGKE